ncbi:MAG: DUF2905 domain-containing protein [Nitrospirota bacterium]
MSGVMGKALILIGALFVLVGVWVLLGSRLPTWLSWLGRLPGDIAIERDNVRFYLPITTSIILSILLTLLLWFFGRR